ncbi:serine hydrolase [Paucibacter sp. XJ19-41]|nr:serine hydrolase [Paucibacter sp. XJ19-41]
MPLAGCDGDVTVNAATPSPPALPAARAAVRELLQSVSHRHDLAFVLAVAGPGGEWVEASGLADRARGEALSAGHFVQGYSITKLLTASAVLRLVDQGRVALDAPIALYLAPALLDGRPGGGATPVRALLDHSAAIPNFSDTEAYDAWLLGSDAELPLQAQVQLVQGAPLLGPQGQSAYYSNTHYALLALLIEAVTGDLHERFVRAEVLLPLGLSECRYGRERSGEAYPQARYYSTNSLISKDGKPVDASALTHKIMRNELGSGGLEAPAPAFVRLLQGVLRPGLLSAESRIAMQRWQPLQAGMASIPEFYGLGLMRLDHDLGQRAVGHPGSGVAWSYLAHLPDSQQTFFLATTTGDAPADGPLYDNFQAVRAGVVRLLAG